MIFQGYSEYFVRNPQMWFSHIGWCILLWAHLYGIDILQKISEINSQANPYRTDTQAGILVKGGGGRGGSALDTALVLT